MGQDAETLRTLWERRAEGIHNPYLNHDKEFNDALDHILARNADLLAALEWTITWVDREVIGRGQRAEVIEGLHTAHVAVANAAS